MSFRKSPEERAATEARRKELTKQWAADHPERMKQLAYESEQRNYEERQAYKKAYYQRNKAAIAVTTRRNKLKRKYGVTPDQVDKLSAKQEHKCAICGDLKPLRIDHCHASGKVRGLLCHNCNTALGHFRDNTDTLKKAIRYVRRGQR